MVARNNALVIVSDIDGDCNVRHIVVVAMTRALFLKISPIMRITKKKKEK
jgi:hypothetical protein